MREAWKRETYVQSFSSESAVKYLHVGRRKIQISPPLGEQDQSNPHPMPHALEHVQVHLKEIKVMLIYKRPSNICLLF